MTEQQNKLAEQFLRRTGLSSSQMEITFVAFSNNNVVIIEDDHRFVCRESCPFLLPLHEVPERIRGFLHELLVMH